MQRERQLARLSQEPQAFVSHARKGRGFHALVGFSRPYGGSTLAQSEALPLRGNVETRSVDY